MKRYVAFLRAINVAGHASIRMDDVQEAFTTAGCRNVRTYIQSGNVVFDALSKEIDATVRRAGAGLRRALRLEPDIIVRALPQVEGLLKQAPFKAYESKAETKLYVSFLKDRPRQTPDLPLISKVEALEVVAIDGLDVMVVSRKKKNGFFGFPNLFIEKSLAVPATSRNWSTVTKIVEFANTVSDVP